MNQPGGTLELAQHATTEPGVDVASPADGLLCETPEVAGAQSAGMSETARSLAAPGGWFADPTPGVDELGRQVYCRGCSVALSQPRIDYGLNACPGCRPVLAIDGRR